MAKKRFYGVAGTNGYGVYNDYDKVLEAKPYVQGFRVKGFPYYREARTYATDTYKRLAYGRSDVCGTYDVRRMNRFYHRNPAREQKIQDRMCKEIVDKRLIKDCIVPFTVNI